MAHPDPDRLARVPLFDSLSADQRRRLSTWMEAEEYEAGQLPVRTSEHGYAFYVLDDGQAHAELDGQVLEKLDPGAVFGEMAFFSPNSRRSATVVADTPIRVFRMFGTYFRQMQMEMPEVAARLNSLVEQRQGREETSRQQH